MALFQRRQPVVEHSENGPQGSRVLRRGIGNPHNPSRGRSWRGGDGKDVVWQPCARCVGTGARGGVGIGGSVRGENGIRHVNVLGGGGSGGEMNDDVVCVVEGIDAKVLVTV